MANSESYQRRQVLKRRVKWLKTSLERNANDERFAGREAKYVTDEITALEWAIRVLEDDPHRASQLL